MVEAWIICFWLALALLIATVIFAGVKSQMKYKSGRLLDPSKILFGGVLLTTLVLFMPVHLADFATQDAGWLKSILLSFYSTLQLFSIDSDFDTILISMVGLPETLRLVYSWLAAVLFVMAPILTFGFVLSFFKNLSAYRRFLRRFHAETFIFSELNERSLALAESLHNKDRKRLLVFTDVFEKNEEISYELVERAKELGAICFKKDILAVNFRLHNPNRPIHFFIFGENDSENIKQALSLITNYKDREKASLYVFSHSTEGELLLNSVDRGRMKVRRVNEVRSLVSRTLFEEGVRLFENARPEESGEKTISALIVGMGQHGSEMTKALSWFCQMDGYRLIVNAFDAGPQADSLFEAQCPELMHPKYNGDFTTDGEAHYQITVHPGMDVNTKKFMDQVLTLPSVTYVFVALGDDERNVSVAVNLRMLFERCGLHPKIQAIVYNSEKKEALMKDIMNFKEQPYDIEFVGDMKVSYSEDVVLGSAVEKAALSRHLLWRSDAEELFWQFEYYYKSSIASVIHQNAVWALDLPGARLPSAEREKQMPEAMWALAKLEHCRWNAYTRSEGYCYNERRYDLAKTHSNLVPFDQLDLGTQKYDIINNYYHIGEDEEETSAEDGE